MPELPEVETVARDLAEQITGARLATVEKLDWPRMVETPTPEAFTAGLAGRRIERIRRRAKWLLIELDAGLTLALHLRMSGSLGVVAAGEPVDAHTHLVLALEDGRRLAFRDVRKFGRARLLDRGGVAALEAAHGPEPLEEAFTAALLSAILAGRGTRLKPLLLDQSAVAGLGNIYVDESLWLARLHPLQAAGSLKPAEVKRLHAAIREVLTLAVERRGSTLRDYRTGYGEKGNNQDSFRVYDRAGEACQRCGTPIERLVVAQRGTHVCPTCQPKAKG